MDCMIGAAPYSNAPYSNAPSGRWPGASGTDFLWSGGLWFGGCAACVSSDVGAIGNDSGRCPRYLDVYSGGIARSTTVGNVKVESVGSGTKAARDAEWMQDCYTTMPFG